MIDRVRARLGRLLRERSVRTGDFTLSSGARSNLYVDARLTTFHGEGQALIGIVGLAALDRRTWSPALIGGLTLGADPIACAIAHKAALEGRALNAFTVRKEVKEHGTGRRIEGADVAGLDCVIVEDVITTGGSALRAIDAVRFEGGNVIGVLALVDRQEGGRERIENADCPVDVLFTAAELTSDA